MSDPIVISSSARTMSLSSSPVGDTLPLQQQARESSDREFLSEQQPYIHRRPDLSGIAGASERRKVESDTDIASQAPGAGAEDGNTETPIISS